MTVVLYQCVRAIRLNFVLVVLPVYPTMDIIHDPTNGMCSQEVGV